MIPALLIVSLRDITCPTLVLVGKQDGISPPAEMATMAAAIPDAGLVEIDDAGHLSNLENPTAFIAAIENFI